MGKFPYFETVFKFAPGNREIKLKHPHKGRGLYLLP